MPRDESETRHPTSVRFSAIEHDEIERSRGNMSQSDYVRHCMFHSGVPLPTHRPKNPVKDQTALSRVFARLGQAHYASNLNQLARLANMGALEVTPDINAALNETCDHLNQICADARIAFGFKLEP